jgi:glycosyltransferase involved in cell wall biosynthesis
MKIALVTPGGFDRSGTERVLPVFLSLVERLAQRHEVHVYTLYQYPQPQEYRLAGAAIHNLGYAHRPWNRPGELRRALQVVLKEHRRARFDVLHGLWASESGLLAGLAARLGHAPGVVTAMCGEVVALPAIRYGAQLGPKGRLLTRLALRMPHVVTCESHYALRLLRPHRPDARVLTFGADCRRFTPPTDLPTGPPWNLLHVAGLNRVKDQATLLRAFARIHAAQPQTHLDIIGVDTLNGEIHALAADLGLCQAVTFHGFQTSDMVADRMRQAHLLLHSSLSEAAPLVFLEAAACRLPTVGTAVGLIADHAPDAALAVPVGDDESLARAALDLLAEEPRRRALGQRAYAVACKCNANVSAQQVEALYAELAQTS